MTSLRSDTVPDVARSDVSALLFSTWRVGTPERQRAAADAIGAAWEARPWPTRELRSYSVFAGEDGDTLLHYSQWLDEGGYDAFVRSQRQERNDEIDAAVPGIRRIGLHRYRLYRSTERATGDRVPGCFVAVNVEFDGADMRRQREWVDGVFAAAAGAPSPEGLIAAHMHLGTDGMRVLNFAEWTDARVHRAFAPGAAVRAAVREFPGVKGVTSQRFRMLLHLAAPEEA